MYHLFDKYFNKLNERSKDVAVVAEEKGIFTEITYEQLGGLCYSLQVKIGLAENEEKIAILIKNRIEFIVAFLTALFSGYSIVAINNAASMEEKEKILAENNISKVLTISQNKEEFNNVSNIFVDILGKSNGVLKQIKTARVCIVSYTSGTSGKFSKGVKLSYENILCTVRNYSLIYNMHQEDKMLIALPLWHNYGMIAGLCSALHVGCQILLLEKWVFESFREIVSVYKATIFPGSPYMYIDIVENFQQKDSFNSLRVCDSGGDTLPVECIQRFENKTGAIITEGYGLTETSSLTHFNFSAKERKLGSIGKCVDGVNCLIKDINGKEVKSNEWGLLYISGDMVFCGYVESGDHMEKQNNWFNTNDIAKVDSEGYYYIAGRYSDMKSIDDAVHNNRRIENDIYKSNMVERTFVKREIISNLGIDCYKIYTKLKRGKCIKNLQQYVKEVVNYVVIDEIIEVEDFTLTDTGKIKREK